MYRRLVEALEAPRRLVLNYSGESLCYPELIPAIELGRSRGAFIELVTAFPPVDDGQLRALATCGLGRLTISVHATDPQQYAEIYRYSSFNDLEARLCRFLELSREASCAPVVDFAFVAMDRNLDQLEPVAGFAERIGAEDLLIFPVMRRDEIPESFSVELGPDGSHLEAFRWKVQKSIAHARLRHDQIRFTICNPAFDPVSRCLGEVPVAFPEALPAGARIHTCEQNPWETAHVLSNGDVVVCEILDKAPMGNLFEQSIEEIWNGPPYQEFRRRYPLGEIPECRRCVWKSAYRPGPLKSDILAREGLSAQLLHGWHPPSGEDVIWSTQQAAAVVQPRAGSQSLHVSALLPPGPPGEANELVVAYDGSEVGRVTNPWEETIPFGLSFSVPSGGSTPWRIQFRTKHVFRPSERDLGPDTRDLGFALLLLASDHADGGEREIRHVARLTRLRHWVEELDRLGAGMRRLVGRRYRLRKAPPLRPGITVVIPERDNVEELSACLDSLARAKERSPEPVQVVVVVNGADPRAYEALRREFRDCEWLLEKQPLGFAEAVRRGLRKTRFEWVYLLNNDVTLDQGAIAALLPSRAPDVFAIGSQIFLKDPTRYREETNWTAMLIENGLASVHDRIPPRAEVAECFYAGGGASLFQRRALEAMAATAPVYAPFYWEDVEWGWRARKRGYRVLFSPGSVVHHRQRATISRHYGPAEVETIFQRNRLLFQLRNVTAAGSLDRLFEEIARLPDTAVAHFRRPWVVLDSARVRLWNHLAALEDQQILPADQGMRP